jgi:hypothetical protein
MLVYQRVTKTKSWSNDLDDNCGTPMTLHTSIFDEELVYGFGGSGVWGALRSYQEFRNYMVVVRATRFKPYRTS